MKFILSGLLFLFSVVTLQAGKVTWSDDGTAIIAGTEGKGCTQSVFGTEEDENSTKANCS